MVTKLRFLLLLFCVSTFASCIIFKRKATKTGKAAYEVFFINDSTLQYFIKPLEFASKSNQLSVDFTFRKSKTNYSEITMNYSLYSRTTLDNNETCKLICGEDEQTVPIKNMLFKENKGKWYIYRYSANFSFELLQKFLSSNSPKIEVMGNTLKPTAKTRKKTTSLNERLLNFELK